MVTVVAIATLFNYGQWERGGGGACCVHFDVIYEPSRRPPLPVLIRLFGQIGAFDWPAAVELLNRVT